MSISTSLESEVETAKPNFLARFIGFLKFEIFRVNASVQPSSVCSKEIANIPLACWNVLEINRSLGLPLTRVATESRSKR